LGDVRIQLVTYPVRIYIQGELGQVRIAAFSSQSLQNEECSPPMKLPNGRKIHSLYVKELRASSTPPIELEGHHFAQRLALD
jgi:hypothetical protein